MIPSRIIQTHRSRSCVPQKDSACLKRVAALHPNWDIQFFSDGDCREFIKDMFPQYLELYDWYPRSVQRADLFRVVSVFALGGFYLDTDVWLTKSLNELRDNSIVFPWERVMQPEEFEEKFPKEKRGTVSRMQVGNYAFGSVKGHPILADIVDEMILRTEAINVSNCTAADVLFSTGPDLITEVAYRHLSIDSDLTILDGEAGQDPPFGDPYYERYGRWFRFGGFGTHLMSGVWRDVF